FRRRSPRQSRYSPCQRPERPQDGGAPPPSSFRSPHAVAGHPRSRHPQRALDRRGLWAHRTRADADLRRPAHHQFCAWRSADGRYVRGVLRPPVVRARSLPRGHRTHAAVLRAGYCLQRFVIGPAAHGEDRNILLVTLGLAVVIENVLLHAFGGDTRTLNLDYAFNVVDLGIAFLALPRVIGFGVVLV